MRTINEITGTFKQTPKEVDVNNATLYFGEIESNLKSSKWLEELVNERRNWWSDKGGRWNHQLCNSCLATCSSCCCKTGIQLDWRRRRSVAREVLGNRIFTSGIGADWRTDPKKREIFPQFFYLKILCLSSNATWTCVTWSDQDVESDTRPDPNQTDNFTRAMFMFFLVSRFLNKSSNVTFITLPLNILSLFHIFQVTTPHKFRVNWTRG